MARKEKLEGEIAVEVWIMTDKVGSKCSKTFFFEEEDWNSMTDTAREECCQEVAFQMMDWGYSEK